MNSYNDNLLQTVNQTLTALGGEQAQLASAQITAQYNLYYAQGAEITARDKLALTRSKADFYCSVNDQGVVNDNQVNNALASATQANTNVATAISNVATAASNVQIASNAVALLASDIGAALNVATASLYNSDIYDKIKSANNLINETANDAKTISLSSMEAAGETSSIIAPTVMNDASTTKAKLENLLKLTTSEYAKFADLAISENKDVSTASKAEHKAEGALRDANQELAAITETYNNTSKQLNFNLSVSVQSSTKITVSFDQIVQNPFVTQQALQAGIPPMNPVYYVTLVPSDKQELLTTEQAEQLFSQQSEQPAPGKSPVKVNSAFTCVAAGSTVLELSTTSIDAFGSPVQAGQEYVAFLYIVVDLKYKQFISNFNDILSAPSQSFIPATNLPEATANNIKLNQDSQSKKISFTFNADYVNLPVVPGETASVQYRCIFMRSSLQPKRGFLTNLTENKSPVYFDSGIAQQVGPSNYTIASKINGQTPPGERRPKKGADGDETTPAPVSMASAMETYSVEIEADTTDNFGDPLIPDQQYKPYILAVIDGSQEIASQFVPTLSTQLPDVVPNPSATSETATTKETK